jgi:hypothetical protein
VASIQQTSFVGGELSPTFQGRTESPKYASGLKRCRNFFPVPTGAALNRPGTKFICEVANSDQKVRLIPFIYSDGDTYVLEFGDGYIRFIKNGTPVTVSPGVRYFVPIDYEESDLPEIQYAQVGDVLYLTHRNWDPLTVTRLADTNWVVSTVDLTPPAACFTDADYGQEPAILTSSIATEDLANGMPDREWIWWVTSLVRDNTTGQVQESAPFKVVSQSAFGADPYVAAPLPARFAVYPSKPIALRWPTTATPTSTPAGQVIGWRVYRGRGRLGGMVGETTSREFIDQGDEPNYEIQPPSGIDPFQVFDRSGNIIRTEHPAAVAIFEQRLGFGGTIQRPSRIWLSAVGDFYNLGIHTLETADGPVESQLAALRREEIRWMAGLDRLFIGTSGGVWSGSDFGADRIPLLLRQAENGSSSLAPLVIGDTLFYVRSKGVGINEVAFEQERGKYGVSDVTTLAKHLFQYRGAGLRVVDWAYAEDPYSIAWAVRQDGVLLSLTYDRQHNVAAWAWHDTENAFTGARNLDTSLKARFEAVCTVPEGEEDAVYVVVRREVEGQTRRYIERFASRGVGNIEASWFLDSAVFYIGVRLSLTEPTPTTSIGGLDHLEGKEVWALIEGEVCGPYTVASGAIAVDFPDVVSGIIGLKYSMQVQTLDVAEARTSQKNVTAVVLDVESSRGASAGPSFEKLKPWQQRRVQDGFGTLAAATGQARIALASGWEAAGSVCIEQVDPLPLALLGITREVEPGGKP